MCMADPLSAGPGHECPQTGIRRSVRASGKATKGGRRSRPRCLLLHCWLGMKSPGQGQLCTCSSPLEQTHTSFLVTAPLFGKVNLAGNEPLLGGTCCQSPLGRSGPLLGTSKELHARGQPQEQRACIRKARRRQAVLTSAENRRSHVSVFHGSCCGLADTRPAGYCQMGLRGTQT